MIVYSVLFFAVIFIAMRYVSIFKIPTASPWLMPAAFALKAIVGLGFIYVYSYHYGVGELTADGSEFMADSKILHDVFYQSPVAYLKIMFGLDDQALMMEYLGETTQWAMGSVKVFNDTRNLIRLHSLIYFFSRGELFIHILVVAVIALCGIRFITLAIAPYSKLSPTLIFLAFLCMPNVLFWSAGILKEPLILFTLGLFLYVLLKEMELWKKVNLLILSLFLLVGIKPYLLFCILIALIAYFILKYIKNRLLAYATLAVLAIASLGSLLTPVMKPVVDRLSFQQFDFDNIGRGGVYARADTCVYIIYGESMPFVEVNTEDSTVFLREEVVGDYIIPPDKKGKKRCVIQPNETPWKLYYDGVFSGSYIKTTMIAESAPQLIKNIPEAIVNTNFRPTFSDPPASRLKYMAIIDGWGLLFILVLVILFFRRPIDRKSINIIISLIVFSITLSLLIGWTTPVLGAIIRYKIPIQLATMLIICLIVNPQKKWK